MTIKNLNLNKNGKGIYFWNTSQSRIQNVNASNNDMASYLSSSSNNTLSGNNASSNERDNMLRRLSNNYGYGIFLAPHSSNNTLNRQQCIQTTMIRHGIISVLFQQQHAERQQCQFEYNTIYYGNTLRNIHQTRLGISLYSSSNNTLSGNNASNN